MEVNGMGPWRIWWGAGPIPAGAVVAGTVRRRPGDHGALFIIGGRFWQGNAGTLRSLPTRLVQWAIERDQMTHTPAGKV